MFPVDRSRDFPSREPSQRHPDVYIFDDSFSALDYKTDAVLRKRIRRQRQQTASYLSWHRESVQFFMQTRSLFWMTVRSLEKVRMKNY